MTETVVQTFFSSHFCSKQTGQKTRQDLLWCSETVIVRTVKYMFASATKLSAYTVADLMTVVSLKDLQKRFDMNNKMKIFTVLSD